MGLIEVKDFFAAHELADRIIIVDDSSATVAQAAQSLNTKEARIAKTLAFMGKEEPYVIVMAGDAKIDNRKYKDEFKTKAKMLSGEEVVELTGHEVGGVCPFALKTEDMKIYLDESLKRFTTVFPACGSKDSAIELTLEELDTYCKDAKWIDVTKDWDEGLKE